MERRSDPIDCEGKNRIGHEFYSCQFEPFDETGFSRWGVKGGPQGLKPVSHARFDGTTTSRALPSRGVGPMQWWVRSTANARSLDYTNRLASESICFARNDISWGRAGTMPVWSRIADA